MTACAPEQALGLHLLEFVHADDGQRVQQAWARNCPFDAPQSLEFRLARSDSWCAAYWVRFHQAEHAPTNTILVLADSTTQHQQSEQWWAMAHTDLLTGLPNRNLFMDRCAQTLTLARRRSKGAAILWLDLDGFKAVNDRLGGDEFAVIMSDISHAQSAGQDAQGLVQVLRSVFELPQGQAHVSASVGIALFPQHGDSVEALMRSADVAMYSAKHTGKDRMQVWSGGGAMEEGISSQL
jgi:GGDEF domain-containing protein